MKNTNPSSVSLLLITALAYTASTSAALIGRDLDGNTSTAEAYYDNDLNISWLADTNYAQTMGHSTISNTGRMTWEDANNWAAGLNIHGTTGWRMPTTLQPDSSCSVQSDNLPPGGDGTIDTSWGFNCIGSELGHMFYIEMGGAENTSIEDSGKPGILEKFTNLKPTFHYWTDTEYAPDPNFAWAFTFSRGIQEGKNKAGDSSQGNYAWAVHDGIVGTAVVPVPASVWLFGTGLLSLLGLATRRTRA